MSRPEKPCVLLVDDNEATCTLITALLQLDYIIETAADGTQALEKLKTGNYDAVLLDLRMPQLDGFGVLEYLEANRRDMLSHIIVLTAALTKKEIERAKSFAICAIISKPFELDDLQAAVKACIGPSGNPFGSVLTSGVVLLLADLIRRVP